MIKSSTQVKALIKNKAKGNSNKAQMLLRVYVMERFLERISLSEYRDNFILKGGLLVSSLVGVDFFFVEGTLDKLRQSIKIDLSTGDEITPSAIEYQFPLMLEKRTIPIMAYNLETLLAEKLETIMVRAETNTRMRDFYDIHVIFDGYKQELNPKNMSEAFMKTCKKRGSEKYINELDSILEVIANNDFMASAWERYRVENFYVEDLDWLTVNKSARKLKDFFIFE